MDILTAVIIVAVIGLVLGLGLAVASIVFAVPKDEKAEAIRECLPGANCGACGFSGCDGYANALAKGETENTALCSPGGNAVSKEIAGILGVAAGEVMPEAAVVLCMGHNGNANLKYDYQGVESCRMASQLYGGPKECVYGCLGLGDCVKACPYNAIHICDGVARINPVECRACKMCVNTCPKGLIEMMPLHRITAAVLCKNHDKGAITRKEDLRAAGAFPAAFQLAGCDHLEGTKCGAKFPQRSGTGDPDGQRPARYGRKCCFLNGKISENFLKM